MDPAESLWVLPERRDGKSRDALLRRVRAEFEELPSLRLTEGQARRLFGLRPDICDRILATLMRDRVLGRDAEGRFRMLDGDVWRGGGAGLSSGRPRLRAC